MPNDIITVTGYHGPAGHRLRCLLKQFVKNISHRSRQYMRLHLQDQGYLDYGLLTNERGSYSLMAAAMDRITPMHQSEMSMSKRVDYRNRANRDRAREQSGRVDLWCCHEGFEYFLEFKHAFVSPGQVHGCTVPKKVREPWHKLVRQIAEVRRGVARNPDYNGYEDRTYFIGMQIVALRQRNQNRKTIESGHVNEFTDAELRRWTRKLSPNPDAVFAWRIGPQDLRIRRTWDEEGHEAGWASFPCHLFCFKIGRN